MQIKVPSERAAPAVRRLATMLKRTMGMAGGRERGEKSETWSERACEHGVDADHATDSERFSHDLFNAPVCTGASADDERKMPGVPFSAGARMNILTRARIPPAEAELGSAEQNPHVSARRPEGRTVTRVSDKCGRRAGGGEASYCAARGADEYTPTRVP